jgi:hypothetical protein
MTRKQRQNVSYDFNKPRDLAAFEALLEEEDDMEPGSASCKPSAKQQAGKKKREKETFFRLRDPQAAGKRIDAAPSGEVELSQLLDLFGTSLDAPVIEAVYLQCNRSLDAAIESLLSLCSHTGGPAGPSGSSSSCTGAPSLLHIPGEALMYLLGSFSG